MELARSLKATAYVTAFLLGMQFYLPARHYLEAYGETYDFKEGRRRSSRRLLPRRYDSSSAGSAARASSRSGAVTELAGLLRTSDPGPPAAAQALRGYRSRISSRSEPETEPEISTFLPSAPLPELIDGFSLFAPSAPLFPSAKV
jgi:hypothetical protein